VVSGDQICPPLSDFFSIKGHSAALLQFEAAVDMCPRLVIIPKGGGWLDARLPGLNKTLNEE
jgi:hypothetical protein